jgi:hypothetical protein
MSENIYGHISLIHETWEVRHDDEIWTTKGQSIGFFCNAPDAQHVVELQTEHREKMATSHWAVDYEFPVEQWKYEVENDDTRLGYRDWVMHQKEDL